MDAYQWGDALGTQANQVMQTVTRWLESPALDIPQLLRQRAAQQMELLRAAIVDFGYASFVGEAMEAGSRMSTHYAELCQVACLIGAASRFGPAPPGQWDTRFAPPQPRMIRLLTDTGLDFAWADPRLAWKAFKQYAAEPVFCEADYLTFQVGDRSWGTGAYLGFTRTFRLVPHDKGGNRYGHLRVEFETTANRLGFPPVVRHSFAFGTFAEFFEQVESLPEFEAGTAYPEWSFQVSYAEEP
jgi:hypothetical protein